MKFLGKGFLIFILLIAANACSTDEGPVDGGSVNSEEKASSYYPGGNGSIFSFRVDTLNTQNSIFDSVGVRTSTILNNVIIGESESFTQNNIKQLSGESFASQINLRRTNAGLYIQVDTAGIFDLISTIPDSLANLITLQVDSEVNFFSTPLFANKSWAGFKMVAAINGGLINLTIAELTAVYVGEEEIFSEAFNKDELTKKINYNLKVNLPDLTNLDLTNLNFIEEEFTATAWFLKDKGLIALEGSEIILNLFSGGFLELNNSQKIVREVLTSVALQ